MIIRKLCRQAGGLFCHLHQQESPSLDDTCEICRGTHIDPNLNAERKSILSDLEKAVNLLQLDEDFAVLVPQVQSNLVGALKSAQNRADVAGFPGRIVKIKDKVKILVSPEFGASGNTADILLSIREISPHFQACLCLKFDERLENLLNSHLGGYLDYVPSANIPIPHFSKKELNQYSQSGFLAIIEKEILGIEPITYLFGSKAQEIAVLAISLAKQYKNES